MSIQPLSEIVRSISDDESNELSVFDQLNEELMSNPSVTSGVTPATPSADDIDLLLGSLETDDAGDAEIEEIIDEEPVEAAALELEELDVGAAEPDDEELRALDISLTKDEAYESAESEIEVIAAPLPVSETVAKKAKAPKAAKAAKTAAPKVERDLKALPAEAFVLTDTPPASLDANKDAVMALRPRQKKIAEKFDQTIAALHAGRKPSTYVVDCFKVLAAKKSVSATDLVAALKADGYTDGTARSQVGQIMALFPVLGIAERAGGGLTLNKGSVFAQKLEAVIA